MTLDELLSHLRQNKVNLWVEGDRLRYQGSQKVMSPELLKELAVYKTEIIAHLRKADKIKHSNSTDIDPTQRQIQDRQLAYKFVGKSGLKVAELALGPYSSTMVNPGADETFSKLLDTYAAVGGNYIDLSNVYTRAEKRVGKWLKDKIRDDFIVASKVGIKAGDGPNDVGLSRKHIMMSIERSLRDIDTDYLDIYYCHIWDGGTPLEETISALHDLVKAGKVRYLGLSNFTGWQLQKAIDIAKFTDKEPFICIQTQYNLIDRYPEWEQIPVCKNEGLGLFAWGSLSAGWLTGRYRRGMSPGEVGDRVSFEGELGIKHNSYEFKDNERTWGDLEALFEVAADIDKSPSQVALNWLKDRPGVVPILGPRNVDQLREGLGAAGWSLTDTQRAKLDNASELPEIMPHMLLNAVNSRDRI